ncbi:MAG TPA: DsbE family thiol:disulfide interchange protein [Burkholderiaceae bacterium]|nr:DsbE family thiol:disulfide interchange protein [Burkholderiaceae bacterium]
MSPRLLVPLCAFILLGALLGAGLRLKPREIPSPLIGKAAPAFSLPLLSESQRALASADLKGKVWLLNVWASWCTPCREEHPFLVALAREQIVPIYGLNYKDDPRAAQEWIQRLGNPYAESVLDRDGKVGIDYGVYGVPETFVIDRSGVIRFKHVGPLTREVWTRDLLPIVQQLRS